MGLTALGIPAHMLTSTTNKEDEKSVYRTLEKGEGQLKVLYVTPEKISKSKRFAYLAANNSILCNAVRAHRHLSNSDACPRCSEAETSLHLLRDCAAIRAQWVKLLGSRRPTSFFTCSDIKEWIFRHVKREDREASLFAHMLWAVWKNRNRLAFDGVDEVKNILSQVLLQVDTGLYCKLACL